MPSPEDLTSTEVLEHLTVVLASLTPELRKAATYILENVNDVGVSSVREIADAADVKPNTLVRLARTIGFDGYEGMRRPFRNDIRQGRDNYPDRARWLQSLSSGGKLSSLYGDMAAAAINNIEAFYSGTDAEAMKAAADEIIAARATYVCGVGIAYSDARNFAYLANMALDNVSAIPQEGSLPVDGLVQARRGDVLIAMTFKPFRREVVEAVNVARRQGVTVIGVSDTPASPILSDAAHRFIIPTDTPQFFSSTIALSAFIETLMAFVIADANKEAVNNIERFHRRRRELGIYLTDTDRLT